MIMKASLLGKRSKVADKEMKKTLPKFRTGVVL